MSSNVITGKAWVGGDDIYAFDIFPQKGWGLDPFNQSDEVVSMVMENVIPEIAGKPYGFRDLGYSIVIAGRNFGGGGKSIEHPIVGLKGAGIKVVLADSFARYNFRNSINNALPVIVCEGLNQIVSTGDEVSVDLETGTVEDLTNGKKASFKPLSGYAMEIIRAGGLIAYTQKKMSK